MHRTILNIVFYLCLASASMSAAYSHVSFWFFSFLAAGTYFLLNPLSYSFKAQKKGVIFLPSDIPRPKTDFLFAMKLAGPRHTFHDSDWDASWLTFLEHRIPSFSLGDMASLESMSDDSFQTIMVAGKGWGEFPSALRDKLERFVSRGGKLILARPYTGLENFYKRLSISYIHDFPELYNFLCHDQSGLKIFPNKNVFTICFDYGLISMALRQGMPRNDFYIRRKLRLKIRQKNSYDLCLDHPHAPLPWLDQLDDALAGKLGLPDARIGKKIILTHDEDYYGATLACVVRREFDELKIPSVNFIVGDSKIAEGVLDRIVQTGSEIGIHWNCFMFHMDKTGAHYNPYSSFKTQMQALSKKLPQGYRVVSNRNHWLKWDHSYTLPLEILSGNGIEIDATLGAWLNKEGPLHGTLRPYRALNQEGNPLPLLEMPTLLYDDANWLTNHLSTGVLNRSCWLNILFHPNIARKNLGLKKIPIYQPLLELRDRGFSFTTFSREMDQWKKPVAC